jgi:hypothetical protein
MSTAKDEGPLGDPKGPLTCCALGRIRTCNLLIRSQMLYPLSYERFACRLWTSRAAFAGTTLHDRWPEAKSVLRTPAELHERPFRTPRQQA